MLHTHLIQVSRVRRRIGSNEHNFCSYLLPYTGNSNTSWLNSHFCSNQSSFQQYRCHACTSLTPAVRGENPIPREARGTGTKLVYTRSGCLYVNFFLILKVGGEDLFSIPCWGGYITTWPCSNILTFPREQTSFASLEQRHMSYNHIQLSRTFAVCRLLSYMLV